MFKLNKRAEGSVSTAIKLVISIVLGGAILFSTTAMVNNTVVPGMVNIFESEHSEGVTVSGDAVSAEIDDAVAEHNEDENAHEELFDTKADLSALDTKADKSELAEKANLTDLNNLVTKSVLQSLSNDVALLRSQVTDPVGASPELAALSARTDALETEVAGQTLKAYPVGSVYITTNSTSPATLFGGTWELLKDRFLLGAGDTYTAGNTGGEATHTLTVAEMPSHSHTASASTTASSNATVWTQASTYGHVVEGKTNNANRADIGNIGITASTTVTIGNSGSGQAHNNMPPYLVVYMWKRTA